MTTERQRTAAPTVSGPVTGGAHGWPFAASLDDLGAVGYVEEEYLVEGEAPSYRATGELGYDGHWSAEPADSARFRTRVLIQRPADASRFNGTVVVGWNNVTAGYELLAEVPALLEEGFAYACASAQQVGVDGVGEQPMGLKAWDPERYGTLVHPGDRYSYGIFSGVATAVGPQRHRAGVDPMGGLAVERVIALGASQSASRLATYINAVQPLAGVFDGFLVLIYFGSASAIDDDLVFDPNVARPAPIFRQRTLLRGDLGVPVMVVNSETETPAYFGARQDDTDQFRFWEVAAAAHVSAPQMPRRAAKSERDGVPMRENPIPPSNISYVPAASAALVHLHRWMTGGPPPPVQPRIEVAAGDPPEIERDEHGNAVAGIRMPGVAVPVAHDTGVSSVAGLAGLGGVHEPFEPDTLVALYGDHATYVARFSEAAAAAVTAGVLRASEADRLVAEAGAAAPF
ncbi:MAG: alpha/beta hydrolase domain-containing protein [Acidimicrobiales bacterium]